jgi:hypothetical protein
MPECGELSVGYAVRGDGAESPKSPGLWIRGAVLCCLRRGCQSGRKDR